MSNMKVLLFLFIVYVKFGFSMSIFDINEFILSSVLRINNYAVRG